MDAAELWMTPVIKVPTKTPIRGLLKFSIIAENCGRSARGAMESDIMVIPDISTANPKSMVPISLDFCFLPIMYMMIPMRANTMEKFLGFNMPRRIFPSLLIPVKERIHAVRVVPISAPKITPTVWDNSMIPELTKPTSITVVAELDWIAMVMITPTSSPLKGLSVTFLRSFSSLPPAVFSRALDKRFIPKRKNASPPKSCTKLKMDTIDSFTMSSRIDNCDFRKNLNARNYFIIEFSLCSRKIECVGNIIKNDRQ